MLKIHLVYKVTPYVALSTLLLLAAIFLRIHNLSDRSLWLDEARAANNSKGTLAETILNTQHRNSSPILYPALLYFVQKIDSSPTAVRCPSAIASVLVILMTLSLPRLGFNKRIAFLAALLLTFSPSQIRYAQEVREYSLSVLIAIVMVYSYFLYLRNENKRFLFLSTMFLAPLVQYGLVLFAAAILVSVGVERLYNQGWRKAISSVIVPSIFLFAGGAISAWLTLRFQWRMTSAWYLSSNYFESGYGDIRALAGFIAINTYRFFVFVMPPLALGLAIPTFGLTFYYCVKNIQREWYVLQIALIAVLAVLVVMVASIAHIYPFGGIRQILFLSPAVALVFAASFLSVGQGLPKATNSAWVVICIAFALFAGVVDIYKNNPYREVEDIRSVIQELDKSKTSEDAVYIYCGARPALNFYKVKGDNFFYGKSHRRNREKYVEEILELIPPQFDRLWLVFSHLFKDEEQFIIEHIANQWTLTKVVHAHGAALYMGIRRREM